MNKPTCAGIKNNRSDIPRILLEDFLKVVSDQNMLDEEYLKVEVEKLQTHNFNMKTVEIELSEKDIQSMRQKI